MIDIRTETNLDPVALDWVARAAVAAVRGVSVGPYGSIVHLADEASLANQNLVTALLGAFGSLAVQLVPSSIPADDVTMATISLLTADVALEWLLVDSTGTVLGTGTEAAVAGMVTLQFKTSQAGVYHIFLARKLGNFASGKVTVTVTEV